MRKACSFVLILLAYLTCLSGQSNQKIERLDFSQEDFFNEAGDYLYEEDEYQIPWQDSYGIFSSLKEVEQIVYNFGVWKEETGTFETKLLKANVIVEEEKESLSIDFIFYGYDKYNLPDDADLPPNHYVLSEYPSSLYPLPDMPFRLVGKEEISIPAGTFECTIIEAIGERESKMKLWMIDSKPGIYARIIEDLPGDFGHYYIYELQELN